MSDEFFMNDSHVGTNTDQALDAVNSDSDESANSMPWRDAELQTKDVELEPKKTIIYRDKTRSLMNASQIDAALTGNEKIELVVDPLYYDVSEEAAQKAKFSFLRFAEDILITALYPISAIYVRFMYGYEGLQLRSLAPPASSGAIGRGIPRIL